MHLIDKRNYMRENTLTFAKFVAQTIGDMTGMSYQIDKSSFRQNQFDFSNMMHTALQFFGIIQGEYILSLEEKTAAKLINVHEKNLKGNELRQLREEFGVFINDVLNNAARLSIEKLGKKFEDLTISPIRIVYGGIYYPDISRGYINIKEDGENIGCSVISSQMNLKILGTLDNARDEILARTREIDQLRGNMKQITDILPELNKRLEELFIVQNILYQNQDSSAGKEGAESVKYLHQLANTGSKIRSLMMTIWSVPLSHTFDMVVQPVERLALKFGKKIRMSIAAGEVEIDRKMSDIIFATLEKAIKVIIQYGIEPPNERLKLGKPEKGHIQLRGNRKSGHITIEIEDDGRSLSSKRLIDMAIRLKMISQDEILSDYEADQLVFQKPPAGASEFWVDMYTIKAMVEKRKGNVEIKADYGSGSLITMTLPIDMIISEGIIIRVAEVSYIVPITHIREIIRPQKDNYHTVEGKGEMIRLRGKVIRIIRLERLFNIRNTRTDPCISILVIVEKEGHSIGILADEVIGKQEVSIQNLEKEGYLKSDYIVGSAILTDGRVGLVLDIENFL